MPQTRQFDFEGHAATLICPDAPAAGAPWIFRTEFLYAFNMADMALLSEGYHIAYVCCSNEYGEADAIAVFKRFHDYLVEKEGLSPRASLFGFSRGGLYACNYTLAHPADVACLYLDAPVLDLRSWPAGLGLGCGSPDEWADCKTRVIHVETVEEILAYRGAPIDHMPELVATGIPTLIVAGDSDRTVPWVENGARLCEAFRAADVPVTVILKEGCDHHPHSLSDPAPIVAFVQRANENG